MRDERSSHAGSYLARKTGVRGLTRCPKRAAASCGPRDGDPRRTFDTPGTRLGSAPLLPLLPTLVAEQRRMADVAPSVRTHRLPWRRRTVPAAAPALPVNADSSNMVGGDASSTRALSHGLGRSRTVAPPRSRRLGARPHRGMVSGGSRPPFPVGGEVRLLYLGTGLRGRSTAGLASR